MSAENHVRLEQAGETLIVSPLITSSRFTEEEVVGEWNGVLQKVAGEDVKHLVVDLKHVPYFGSTLLDWMVQMWRRVQEKQGTFAVCCASQVGREVLLVARLDKLWGIYDSRPEAMKASGPT